MKIHEGSCHCGAISFTSEADIENESVIECNCSHCARKGFRLMFIPSSRFNLKSGDDNLTLYQFNKKHIEHLFCKTCGVQAFAKGKNQDGSDMIAVNIRCLPDVDQKSLTIVEYNGKDA